MIIYYSGNFDSRCEICVVFIYVSFILNVVQYLAFIVPNHIIVLLIQYNSFKLIGSYRKLITTP